MDEGMIRKYAEAHGDAVVKGDQQHLMADIAPEALAALGPVAAAMPNPVKSASVESVDAGGDEAVVRICYSGDDKTTTVQSRWAQKGDRPVIVAAEVV